MRYTEEHQPDASNINVRIPGLPIDRRREYIEHICQIMIENRFPAARRYKRAFQFSADPAESTHVFLQDRGDGLEPMYRCDTLSQRLWRKITREVIGRFLERHKHNFTAEDLEFGYFRLAEMTSGGAIDTRGSPESVRTASGSDRPFGRSR